MALLGNLDEVACLSISTLFSRGLRTQPIYSFPWGEKLCYEAHKPDIAEHAVSRAWRMMCSRIGLVILAPTDIKPRSPLLRELSIDIT